MLFYSFYLFIYKVSYIQNYITLRPIFILDRYRINYERIELLKKFIKKNQES